MSKFININMNMENAKMTYIMKWREYVFTVLGYFKNEMKKKTGERGELS